MDNNIDLKDVKKRLLHRKKNILAALNGSKADLLESNSSIMSDDVSSEASLAEQMEIISHLATVEAQEIDTINEALAKIENCTYGVCECGKQINKARLDALPYAVRCIKCQTEFERE